MVDDLLRFYGGTRQFEKWNLHSTRLLFGCVWKWGINTQHISFKREHDDSSEDLGYSWSVLSGSLILSPRSNKEMDMNGLGPKQVWISTLKMGQCLGSPLNKKIGVSWNRKAKGPWNRQWFSGWWFGCHKFYFPINIGNVIIPIDEL